MATPRRPHNLPAPKSDPVRDLISQKSKAAELARERRRVQELKSELPSIIQDRVGEQIDKLETRLLSEVKEFGQRAIEESTNAISNQLNGRIDTLEKVSKLQTETLKTLRDSSEVADRKVSTVVDQIEKSLASVVPGFALEPSRLPPRSALPSRAVHPQFRLEQATEIVPAKPPEISEIVGKNGFCPNCTSTDVRRANRKGMFEEFLRLFAIAPFRCRACRHKFYRF